MWFEGLNGDIEVYNFDSSRASRECSNNSHSGTKNVHDLSFSMHDKAPKDVALSECGSD